MPPSSLSSAGDSFRRRGIESTFMGIEAPNTEKDALGTRSEVEVVGGCRRRVKASVPADKVRAELDKNYRQLSQSIQLPGFRRGHVPRRLLEARFGEEIEGDVKESLLAVSFAVKASRHWRSRSPGSCPGSSPRCTGRWGSRCRRSP